MMHRVLIVLMCGACVAEPTGVPEGDPVPRMVANALSPAALASGLLTTGKLDGTSAAAMGATADARRVLSYAVGCALDATQSIAFSVGGTPHSSGGHMGVAPAWTARALSPGEAAWVSACVLSRLNLTGTVVNISARGDNAGYDTTIGELADYAIEEGAFWGNVFTDLGVIAGDACDGVDQAADDRVGDLPLRACAQWDGVAGSNRTPCGLGHAGLCSTACTTASPYSGCASQGGARSAAVVTSFLYGSPR